MKISPIGKALLAMFGVSVAKEVFFSEEDGPSDCRVDEMERRWLPSGSTWLRLRVLTRDFAPGEAWLYQRALRCWPSLEELTLVVECEAPERSGWHWICVVDVVF